MNYVELSGNLVANPQMQETSTGKFFCDARLAVWRSQDVTDFIDLRAWDKAADRLVKHEKGDKILIGGSLRVDEYETRDHEKRKRVYVNVHLVEGFLPTREADPKKERNYGVKAPAGLTPVDDEELPF